MDLDVLTQWNADPSVIGGIAGVALGYAILLVRPQRTSDLLGQRVSRSRTWAWGWRQPAAFAMGLLTLGIALASPLDFLADHVLLLAHMLQHLLLLLVAPVFLLWGMPEDALAAVARVGFARLPRRLMSPLAVFAAALGLLWVWHAPAVYEAALNTEPLHAAEHLCFLVTALLFWWPVLHPASCPWRLPDPLSIVYLFAAAIGSSMLAALITFSSELLYSTYGGSAYAATRASLGLSPRLDQQLAGLLMWIAGGLWYFGAAIAVFVRWFSEAEADDVERPLRRDGERGDHGGIAPTESDVVGALVDIESSGART